MATCARCSGTGLVSAFVEYENRPGDFRDDLTCGTCGGSGRLSADRVRAIQAGEARRRDRVARGISLREEADRLGISAAALSRQERGEPA